MQYFFRSKSNYRLLQYTKTGNRFIWINRIPKNRHPHVVNPTY